jgi:LysM repeat protein
MSRRGERNPPETNQERGEIMDFDKPFSTPGKKAGKAGARDDEEMLLFDPEGRPSAGTRYRDAREGKSSFPFKSIGVGLFLVAATTLIYLQFPDPKTGPEAARPEDGSGRTRVVMDVDSGSPGTGDTGAGAGDLKPLDVQTPDEVVRERLDRVEARMDELQTKMERLIDGFALLSGSNAGQPEPGGAGGGTAARGPSVAGLPVTEAAAPSGQEAAGPSRSREAGASVEKAVARPVPKTPAPRSEEKVRYHVVAPGENLYRIGLKYNLTVTRLMALNHLTGEQSVQPGQRLRVSGP